MRTTTETVGTVELKNKAFFYNMDGTSSYVNAPQTRSGFMQTLNDDAGTFAVNGIMNGHIYGIYG